MEQKEASPVQVIGFIIIGIAAVALIASVLFLDRISSAILVTNLAMVGMGIVFVAIGTGQSGPKD